MDTPLRVESSYATPDVYDVYSDLHGWICALPFSAIAPTAILPGDWPAESDEQRAADACWRLQHGER